MPGKRWSQAGWLLLLAAALVLVRPAPASAVAAALEGNRAQYALNVTVSVAQGGNAMGVFPVSGAFNVTFGKRDWQGGHKVDLTLDRLTLPEPMADAQAGLDKLTGKKLTFEFDKHGRLVDIQLPGLPLGKMLEEQGQLPYPKTQNLLQSLEVLPAGTTVSVRTAVPGADGADPVVFTVDFEYGGRSEDGKDYVLRFKFNGDSRALAASNAGSLNAMSSLSPAEQQAFTQMMSKVSFGITATGTLRVSAEHGLPSQFNLETLLTSGAKDSGEPTNIGVTLSLTLEDFSSAARH